MVASTCVIPGQEVSKKLETRCRTTTGGRCMSVKTSIPDVGAPGGGGVWVACSPPGNLDAPRGGMPHETVSDCWWHARSAVAGDIALTCSCWPAHPFSIQCDGRLLQFGHERPYWHTNRAAMSNCLSFCSCTCGPMSDQCTQLCAF